MIYGLDFNGKAIPANLKIRLAQQVKVNGEWYDLKGVCQTENELDWMVVQASDGKRKIHTVDRSTSHYFLYGVYIA